jgi:hypothetical protein
MNTKQHWTAAKQDEIDELEKVNGYLVEFIKAWLVVDLAKPTQLMLDKEIAEIVAGLTNEDDRLTLDQFQANNKHKDG